LIDPTSLFLVGGCLVGLVCGLAVAPLSKDMPGLPYDDQPPDPTPDPAPKPGWKTTEFWLALLPTVFTIVQASGLIPAGDAAGLSSDTSKIVIGIFAVCSVVAYIRSRVMVKTKS
jgi:hypothetical protein